jgi:hypothetical protein
MSFTDAEMAPTLPPDRLSVKPAATLDLIGVCGNRITAQTRRWVIG